MVDEALNLFEMRRRPLFIRQWVKLVYCTLWCDTFAAGIHSWWPKPANTSNLRFAKRDRDRKESIGK